MLGIFLSDWKTVDFSRRSQLHGVSKLENWLVGLVLPFILNTIHALEDLIVSSLCWFQILFLSVLWWGEIESTWYIWPITGLSYQPQVIDECGAIGGIGIGRGNWSTLRKPAPVPLCPPKISCDLTWVRTRAAMVGSRWLNRLSCGTTFQILSICCFIVWYFYVSQQHKMNHILWSTVVAFKEIKERNFIW
jgi:hypothetical protein